MINKWVITENGLDIRSLVQRDMIVSDVNDKPRMLKEMMSSLQWMYWSQRW